MPRRGAGQHPVTAESGQRHSESSGQQTAHRKQQQAADEAASSAKAPLTAAQRASREAGAAAPQVLIFPFVDRAWLERMDGLHRPVGLVLFSAHLLQTAVDLTGLQPDANLLPAAIGGCLGLLFAALHQWGSRRWWAAPRKPLRVVVTGSSRGIGKALAREFLRTGDSVVITARDPQAVQEAVEQLRLEVAHSLAAAHSRAASGSASSSTSSSTEVTGVPSLADTAEAEVRVMGIPCDVGDEVSVKQLAEYAVGSMGGIDVWINNAGYSGSYKAFIDLTPEQLNQIVRTNLGGSLLCTQAAMRVMTQQEGGGHVFNMDGAGADGLPTPMYAAYGATKAAIAHLMGSLNGELQQLQGAGANRVGVHTLSPGMVLTPLLLEGATMQNLQVFNVLCEQPETAAAYLAPRVRTTAALGSRSSYIRYLTPRRILSKLLTAPSRIGRYFDSQGNAVYHSEQERILGAASRRTRRLAENAARRGSRLALAYSACLATSYLLIAVLATSSSSAHATGMF